MVETDLDIGILLQKLAQPAQRAIRNAEIKSLQELSQLRREEFMQLHGIGKNTAAIAEAVLQEHGLSFSEI